MEVEVRCLCIAGVWAEDELGVRFVRVGSKLCSVGGVLSVVQWTRTAVVVVVVRINPTIKALAPRSQQRMQTQWRRRTLSDVKPRKSQSSKAGMFKNGRKRERGRQEDKLRSLSAFPSAAAFLASLGDHRVEPLHRWISVFDPSQQQQWWVRDAFRSGGLDRTAWTAAAGRVAGGGTSGRGG